MTSQIITIGAALVAAALLMLLVSIAGALERFISDKPWQRVNKIDRRERRWH